MLGSLFDAGFGVLLMATVQCIVMNKLCHVTIFHVWCVVQVKTLETKLQAVIEENETTHGPRSRAQSYAVSLSDQSIDDSTGL